MKKFHTYIAHLKIVQPAIGAYYYAYKNGETKIFDNKQDARDFSYLYEVICSEDEKNQRQEIINYHKEQMRLAVEQFNEDLRNESGFNADQIDVCRVFIENYMGESDSDRDVFANCVLAISELVCDINNAKDQ